MAVFVNHASEMGNAMYGFGLHVKAAGSTSIGAFPRVCISDRGFGKAYSEASPFVLFDLLISVESSKKLKQTGPK
jgi:hypothetical protein